MDWCLYDRDLRRERLEMLLLVEVLAWKLFEVLPRYHVPAQS